MAEGLRGFNTPDMPSSVYSHFRNDVKLRANGEGTMEPSYFVNQLKIVRNGAGDRRNEYAVMMRKTLTLRINSEITKRSNFLLAADPNFFNGSTNNDLTPMQALLLAYSVVTDDMLDDNQAGLQTRMDDERQVIYHHWGQQYPHSIGYHAFGENGYWFSTPANLLLDDAATSRILNLIKEKGNL